MPGKTGQATKFLKIVCATFEYKYMYCLFIIFYTTQSKLALNCALAMKLYTKELIT